MLRAEATYLPVAAPKSEVSNPLAMDLQYGRPGARAISVPDPTFARVAHTFEYAPAAQGL